MNVCSGDSISTTTLGHQHRKQASTWWLRNGVKHCKNLTLVISSSLQRTWSSLWVTLLRPQMQIACVPSTWLGQESHQLLSGFSLKHLYWEKNPISLHNLCKIMTHCSASFYQNRLVIGQMTALSYLNLSSCRYLPRGLKRIYRGKEDIHQLLDKLD